MNLPEHIKTILEAAILAPSGENAQPWSFTISDNQIQLFNVPERDQSYYNYNQLGSYVAHGAALENMSIAAAHAGYILDISLLPDPANPNLVAVCKLTLSEKNNKANFYSFIAKRVSNRKLYAKIPLTDQQRRAITANNNTTPGAQLYITEDRTHINRLSLVGSTNERVMLESKEIHNFFFNHLNWTEKEELEKRYGFYIKTLELPPPAKIMFKLFRHWFIMQFFNKLGIGKLVAKGNAQTYSSASAFAVITTEDNSPKSYIQAGRLTQKLWLTITEQGLSLQPLTGILFFMQKIIGGERSVFTLAHQELIENQYKAISETFTLKNVNIAMMFRIGIADAPTARSSRMQLETLLKFA